LSLLVTALTQSLQAPGLVEESWVVFRVGRKRDKSRPPLVRLDPENGRAWYNIALAFTKQERWSEALSAIESAEARMPGSPEVRSTKAIILTQLGRKSEAEAIMRTLPR